MKRISHERKYLIISRRRDSFLYNYRIYSDWSYLFTKKGVFRLQIRAFYIHSIFGIAIGSTLSGILFYFQFLSWDLAIFSSSLLLGFQVGFLLLYKFMEKRNKLFFFLVSIPCLVIFYLAPIFIFNMVYIFKIYKPVAKNQEAQET